MLLELFIFFVGLAFLLVFVAFFFEVTWLISLSGLFFLLISALVFVTGIEIQSGITTTIVNESTTNYSYIYSVLPSANPIISVCVFVFFVLGIFLFIYSLVPK